MGAWASRPLAGLLPGRLGAMLGLAPDKLPPPSPVDRPQTFPARGRSARRGWRCSPAAPSRCIAPQIDEATVRLLTRHGVEVVVAKGAGCCGALTHHMGDEEPALALRQGEHRRLDARARARRPRRGRDQRLGLRHDREGLRLHAARGPGLCGEGGAASRRSARDVTEVMDELGLPPAVNDTDLVVAYHSACSMQHGQQHHCTSRRALLAQGRLHGARRSRKGHLCCGSAGTYNMLQPELAAAAARPQGGEHRAASSPTWSRPATSAASRRSAPAPAIPIVHTVELLDWATGGPRPAALKVAG